MAAAAAVQQPPAPPEPEEPQAPTLPEPAHWAIITDPDGNQHGIPCDSVDVTDRAIGVYSYGGDETPYYTALPMFNTPVLLYLSVNKQAYTVVSTGVTFRLAGGVVTVLAIPQSQ